MNYVSYQFKASQIEWNDELEGIIPKGWILETEWARPALFKQASANLSRIKESRTDWSEKVAYQIAKLIKLPTAHHELAELSDRQIPGIISIDCSQPEDEKRYSIEELLISILPKYDFPEDYTISNVIKSLESVNTKLPPNYQLPKRVKNGADMFVGIVIFDALIGNSDRHDRNLEIVRQMNGDIYLSPVFDNGNSLGATETRSLRQSMSVADYSNNYNAACFQEGERELTLNETVQQAASLKPDAAEIWLEQLSSINPQQIPEIIEHIPSKRITPDAASFALDLLNHNRTALLELQKDKK